MKNSRKVFKAGTRSSELSIIQTTNALQEIEKLVPNMEFDVIRYSSPGDRDLTQNLQESSDDFFTYDLDQAILNEDIDIAIHSAKDVPNELPDKIDWVWLPWSEDSRDVIILPVGRNITDLPENIRIGVSSKRREEYCRNRFPSAELLNIRGTIHARINQLDKGKYDMIIMAAAALNRLGLQHRINEYIPISELEPPEGQGKLCLTFKKDNRIANILRTLFVKTTVFVGAGIGNKDMCTVAGIKALKKCDVCLYDTLLPATLLDYLPLETKKIPVGKRAGAHSVTQENITKMILDEVRKGYNVVRLKGGDPGTFGRLTEEIEALAKLNLPYSVIPGVSSLNVATTGTGILLTKRGVSRGFCVMTPREQGNSIADIKRNERAKLPIVFFMALNVIDNVAQQLLDEGMPPATPVAIVFNAGQDNEKILHTNLEKAAHRKSAIKITHTGAPALIIIGECAADEYKKNQGALGGKRVLLTCSETILDRAAGITRELGGYSIRYPLIKLAGNNTEKLPDLKNYNWLIITSPSSVKILLESMKSQKIDLRNLPEIITCGSSTSEELKKAGIFPAAEPEKDFGCQGLLSVAEKILKPTDLVLRVKSNIAEISLSKQLKTLCKEVTDYTLYINKTITHDTLPEFDIIFFASGSAVESFIEQWSTNVLDNKIILAIGNPTANVLRKYKLKNIIISTKSDIKTAFTELAGLEISKKIEEQI